MAKTYSEKLRDPRWQKKRLKILERDYWTCKICNDKDNTLHVHHKYYEQGCEPWEYEDYALVTVCQDCHKKEEGLKRDVERRFVEYMYETGATSSGSLEELMMYFMDCQIGYKELANLVIGIGKNEIIIPAHV